MITAKQLRIKELASIHIAKKELGLDDDLYRDVLLRVCGVDSASKLDSKGRFKMIAYFKSVGWKQKNKFTNKKNLDAKQRKIWSLWHQLYEAKKIKDDTVTGLRTMCKRITGNDDIRFCTEQQKSKLIGVLKSWLAR